MSATTQQPAFAASRLALPDPGEQVPTISWPVVGIFFGALAVFAFSTWAALADVLPVPVTVLLSATAIFVLFTVLHDAAHYSVSTHRWVNVAFGRVAMLFVSPLISFKSFAFIHIEHHRNTNDDDGSDPDHFVSGAPTWQLPFRFPVMDVPYLTFLVRNVRRRPRAEVAETVFLMAVTVSVVVVCALTGHLWTFAVLYLIPERVAMFVLAWWFDWLPHHDLEDTQQENRYRATRNRVGSEWILTPLLLSQNYHLVHHLHPSIPFHRYVATWRRNEEAYLERDAAIGTVFGQQLDPDEYRDWKQLNGRLARILPVRMPRRPAAGAAEFHPVPVASVDRLTDDSVLIRFDVPEGLREEFSFEAGQHVTVRTDLGGQGVRRNYSLCTSATSGELAIAVKHIPGGAFSTFAMEQLRTGDTLDLLTPTGSFGTPLDPLAAKSYVALVAGSGITPALSILQTTLAVETESRFTLVYGNRDADSTMFREELDDLEAQYADRLRIIQVRSRDPRHPAHLRGRIDRSKLEQWLDTDLAMSAVDEWFLCGPVAMVTDLHDVLIERGTEPDRVHVELFHGYQRPKVADGLTPATVAVTLRARQHEVALAAGDTILESALQAGLDAPYACLGGACGTCKAKVLLGSVAMEQNFALSPSVVEAGYVLTCQAHPTTPSVAVDYDV
ncbi:MULTISPECIES: fatty acid desaturase [unclassified Nocardioides]|uniref:fatty acid desaturase n=1 Tax=unclassified Nocardioides TaxID=2615069 RepID=UPI00070265B2|nr:MULTISPECIES: fatty acid desaturase [unclassified Nocardioides]KRC57005.1 electron transfer flavoprotein [Nocardioides sp. Root79]KRC77214.1 electron transfer flavoprotein [Nocardioides sp. Root240]